MRKPITQGAAVRELLGHIRAPAKGIGPRGATREGDRQGARYAQDQLRRAGLDPVRETFQSARSIFLPHLMGSVLALAGFAVFPIHGRVTAAVTAVLTVLLIVSEFLELAFGGNLFRLLAPKGESQNVWAVVRPRGAHGRDLVLVGHVDTQRTPFCFRTHAWVQVYDKFTTVAFAAFAWQAVLSLLAVFLPIPWAWPALIPAAACAALLAARLKKKPLRNTRVFLVVTGSGEVAHYGMIDFYRRHRAAMKDARAIDERLAAEHPEWGAYATSISGGNTELTDAVRSGVPALALAGKTRDGVVPYWHQRGDTFDKMDPDVMARTREFTLALLEEVDGDSAATGRPGPGSAGRPRRASSSRAPRR